LLFQLGNQSTVLVLGALAGLAQAGGYRAAQSLFGPIIVLMLGVRTAALPELMRRSRDSQQQALRAATTITAAIAVLAALWGASLLFLPDSWGEQILGPTWLTASAIIGLVTVDKACSAIGWGAALRLRVLLRPRVSFVVRVVATVAAVVVAVVGAALDGAWGVALGSALVGPPLAITWLLAVRWARRHPGAVGHRLVAATVPVVGEPE
jgi:O-antigen/teichoic acid export membrane protein